MVEEEGRWSVCLVVRLRAVHPSVSPSVRPSYLGVVSKYHQTNSERAENLRPGAGTAAKVASLAGRAVRWPAKRPVGAASTFLGQSGDGGGGGGDQAVNEPAGRPSVRPLARSLARTNGRGKKTCTNQNAPLAFDTRNGSRSRTDELHSSNDDELTEGPRARRRAVPFVPPRSECQTSDRLLVRPIDRPTACQHPCLPARLPACLLETASESMAMA